MTIKNMEIEEFQKELEKIIQLLIKSDLLPKGTDVPKLAEKVAGKLHNDNTISISGPEIKNDKNSDFKKALGLACMAENKPDNKFDYKNLFKVPPEVSKKDLKNIFDKMLELRPGNKKKKTEQEQEEIDTKLNQLAEIVDEKIIKDNKDVMFNLLGSCLHQLDPKEELSLELYGVVTSTPGAVQAVVQGIVNGDQYGVMDLSLGTDNSLLASKHKVNAIPDPLNIKMSAVIDDIAEGITNTVEKTLIEVGVMPEPPIEKHSRMLNPFQTTPKPPTAAE